MEEKRTCTHRARLALVFLVALGVAGAALLAGLGLIQWLETAHLLTAYDDYDLRLSLLSGGVLTLFTVTLVLGGLLATRRKEPRACARCRFGIR